MKDHDHWESYGFSVNGTTLTHLRFADDVVLFVSSAQKIQEMANELAKESKKAGLEINFAKTFIMANRAQRNVEIDGKRIAYTDGFIYLGTHLHFADGSKTEIQRRIRSAWSVFHKFKTYLTRRNVSNIHKAKIYNMCIEPAFLYGSETWTLKKKERNLLATAQRKMMRWMLGVTLLDRRRNSWLYEKLKLREVRSEAVKRKWLFAKKIATGEDTWAKKIVEWRPWAKTRGVGRPKPRWRDDLRAVLGERWATVARTNKHLFKYSMIQQIQDYSED
ncbi:unnamed protein product [Caenorhabditis auriculariae]|uniref:Reverse transcriptase domain-containing protein n=1 Tax=Caenorhabditis auriculariae TaxID=2777116 RepID=A0A8S1H0Y5_9PELO|nr:unnamed protein product [Caenorhabditis auriculariae]